MLLDGLWCLTPLSTIFQLYRGYLKKNWKNNTVIIKIVCIHVHVLRKYIVGWLFLKKKWNIQRQYFVVMYSHFVFETNIQKIVQYTKKFIEGQNFWEKIQKMCLESCLVQISLGLSNMHIFFLYYSVYFKCLWFPDSTLSDLPHTHTFVYHWYQLA